MLKGDGPRNSVGWVAAIGYLVAATGAAGFQVALVAGAPWGAFAMGGAFPGRFPPGARVAALLQGALIALTAAVVLSRAGVALPSWSRAARRLIWIVVGIAAVSTVLNLITPSAGERALWAPVAVLMLGSSLVVALGGRAR